jgi:hypothetical protein
MKTDKNLNNQESNSIYENQSLSLKYSSLEIEDNSVLNSPYSKTNIDFEKHLEKLRMTSKRPTKAFNQNKSVDFGNNKHKYLIVDRSDFSRKSNTEAREEIRLPLILDSKDTLNQIGKSQQGIMD